MRARLAHRSSVRGRSGAVLTVIPWRADWLLDSAAIKARFLDALDRIVLQSVMGQVWDRAEPAGYMRTLR